MADGTGRSADDIQREIEQARASLATAVDQLAARTSPKRLAAQTKQQLAQRARTPQGMAILGGSVGLVTLLVIARVRAVRRRSRP